MRPSSSSVSTFDARWRCAGAVESAAAADFSTPSEPYFISRCSYDETGSQRGPRSSDETPLTRPTGTVRHLDCCSPLSRERLHSPHSSSRLNFSTLNHFNDHSWYTQQQGRIITTRLSVECIGLPLPRHTEFAGGS